MRNIKVNMVQHVAYTTIVTFNDGEGQLVVTASPAQSGNIAVAVIEAEVDGGVRVLSHFTLLDPAPPLRTCDAPLFLSSLLAMNKWPAEAISRAVDGLKTSLHLY